MFAIRREVLWDSTDQQAQRIMLFKYMFQGLRKTCNTMFSVIQYQKKINTHQHMLE
jgi:hypothetical protein